MSELVQLDREQLKQLDQESLVELILLLQQQLAAQQELIQQLQELLQQLQEQAAKGSHNRGKPPGSDKGRRKSLRRSGKRPRGGQR